MPENYMDKLVAYVKKNFKKGYTENSLKWALVSQGYSQIAVENAIKKVHLQLAEQAPILKEKPKITHQIIDEHNRPIMIKKSWLKRIFE